MAKIIEILKNDNNKDNLIYKRQYISRKEIGSKVLESFKKLYDREKGYALDNGDNKKFGILSNIMALSTYIELIGMDISVDHFLEEFNSLIEHVFNGIYPKGLDEEIFDASPYIFNNKETNVEIVTYVETISKAAIVLNDLRIVLIDSLNDEKFKLNVNINGKNYCEIASFIPIVEKALIGCLKALNKSCLINDNPVDYKIGGKIIERHGLSSQIKYRGWSFQAPKDEKDSSEYETSIYYTYHATNTFLLIYKTFSDNFDYYFEDIKPTSAKLEEKKYKLNETFFKQNMDILSEFRYKTVCSGRYIDNLLRKQNVDVSIDYVQSNFKAASFSDSMQLQDNVAMNTLFILAILISAGLDDDYKYADQKNYLLEQIQFALSNVKKVYYYLKRDKREESISSYSISLLEKCPEEAKEVAQKLRLACKRVDVYPFVALYCNTYSPISDYLIDYPQKEMCNNIDWIMENKNDSEWLWDKKGYNINSNVYYLFALENFYDYYQKYEEPFLKRDAENGREISKFDKERKKYNDTVENLKFEISELTKKHNEEIVKIQKEGQEDSPLVTQLKITIEEVLKEKFESEIQMFLKKMLQQGRYYVVEMKKHLAENNYDDKAYSEFAEKLAEKYPYAKDLFELSLSKDYSYILADNNINFSYMSVEEADKKILQAIADKIKVAING